MSKPKRPSAVEAELARIAACRADPTTPAAMATLRAALAGRSSFAVAAAARLVGEAELEELAPLLAPAYARVADHDPVCHAKTAIVEALCRLGRDEAETFLHAARCRQVEAAVDTAAALRAHAAAGLTSTLHPEAGATIARLLADPEWVTRAGAARAAGRLPADVGVPLLVLRASLGDPQPEVLGDCFRALLEAAPERMLGFVAARLDADAAEAEQAALALGESRLEGAFAPLAGYAERALGPRRAIALLALALLRRDEAYAALLALVAEADLPTAASALEALAVHKHDARLRDAALAAARARGDALVARAERALS
jgi:hypothetical protein